MNQHKNLPFSLETGTVWTLAAIAVVIPFIFIPLSSVPFTFTKTALIALGTVVALILYILTRLRRGSIIVPPLAIIGALWLVPLSLLLASIFSGSNATHAFFGGQFEATTLGFVLSGVVLATVAALTLRRKEQLTHFSNMALIGFGIALIAQLLLLFTSLGWFAALGITLPAGASILGGLTDLAVFFGAGVMGLLIGVQTEMFSSRAYRYVYALLAGALFFLVILNITIVWIAMGVFALGLFMHGMLRQGGGVSEDNEGVQALYAGEAQAQPAQVDMAQPQAKETSKSLVLSLIVLALSLIFIVGSGSVGQVLTQTFGTDQVTVRPSWNATLEVTQAIYAENFLFGTGPQTFGRAWLENKPQEVNESVFWNVDFSTGVGYVPTMVATTGFLGLIAWILFFAGFLFFGFRALIASQSNKQMFTLSLTTFVIAGYLWLMSVLTVLSPALLIFAFLATGVFVGTLRFTSGGTKEWGIFFARSPRIGFVLVFALTLTLLASIASIYFVGERYLASLSYNSAVGAAQSGDFTKAQTDLERALTLAPADRHYRLAAVLGQSQMIQIMNDDSLAQEEASQQFQAALGQSVDSAIRATQLNEYNYQNWTTLGDVYQTVVPLGIEGAYDNALAAYEEARLLNPNSPAILLVMARLEIANENPDRARELLNEAIAMKQDYVDAIFLLSQLEVQVGNTTEALQSAEAAAFFQQNNPNILFQVALLRQATGDVDGAIVVLERIRSITPTFANARYVLAALYAQNEVYDLAIVELEALSELSEENQEALADEIEALRAGENPFPESIFETSAPLEA